MTHNDIRKIILLQFCLHHFKLTLGTRWLIQYFMNALNLPFIKTGNVLSWVWCVPVLGPSLLHSAGCHWPHPPLSVTATWSLATHITVTPNHALRPEHDFSLSLAVARTSSVTVSQVLTCLAGAKCSVVTSDPDISCSVEPAASHKQLLSHYSGVNLTLEHVSG